MNLDYSIIISKFDLFLKGCYVTLEISLASLIIGTIIGIILAICRISSSKFLKFTSGTYVWIMRGTPLLVQLFIIYFGS